MTWTEGDWTEGDRQRLGEAVHRLDRGATDCGGAVVIVLRILAPLFPGIFRIAVILACLTAAALAGALMMAEKIRADQDASNARAEWVIAP